jgi:hypothetical protein
MQDPFFPVSLGREIQFYHFRGPCCIPGPVRPWAPLTWMDAACHGLAWRLEMLGRWPMAMGHGGSLDGRRFIRNVCLERYDETVEQPELLLRDSATTIHASAWFGVLISTPSSARVGQRRVLANQVHLPRKMTLRHLMLV